MCTSMKDHTCTLQRKISDMQWIHTRIHQENIVVIIRSNNNEKMNSAMDKNTITILDGKHSSSPQAEQRPNYLADVFQHVQKVSVLSSLGGGELRNSTLRNEKILVQPVQYCIHDVKFRQFAFHTQGMHLWALLALHELLQLAVDPKAFEQ